MHPNDASYGGKSKSSTALGRCKEGFEDASEIFFVDAATVVGYFDQRFIGRFLIRCVLNTPDATTT